MSKANISVPSRFACLKLEDDEPVAQRKVSDKKKSDKVPLEKKVNNKKIQNNHKQGNEGKKDKKAKQQMQKQWEEWKEKDDKFVDGNFEQDLESAILLSKLHYEENKDKYNSKAGDNNKKPNNKKKKKNVMSLNEFLTAKEKVEAEEDPPAKCTELKENFFDEVHTDAKKELTKDHLTEKRKQREAAIEDIISSAQYQEKLDIERKKNKELEEELEKAKEEISSVKSRNQTLYTMLSTGEMKDKADVLLELERLNIIKNDLTDEVSRLYGLLEQERSKVAALMNDNKHKDKKFKKHA